MVLIEVRGDDDVEKYRRHYLDNIRFDKQVHRIVGVVGSASFHERTRDIHFEIVSAKVRRRRMKSCGWRGGTGRKREVRNVES